VQINGVHVERVQSKNGGNGGGAHQGGHRVESTVKRGTTSCETRNRGPLLDKTRVTWERNTNSVKGKRGKKPKGAGKGKLGFIAVVKGVNRATVVKVRLGLGKGTAGGREHGVVSDVLGQPFLKGDSELTKKGGELDQKTSIRRLRCICLDPDCLQLRQKYKRTPGQGTKITKKGTETCWFDEAGISGDETALESHKKRPRPLAHHSQGSKAAGQEERHREGEWPRLCKRRKEKRKKYQSVHLVGVSGV